MACMNCASCQTGNCYRSNPTPRTAAYTVVLDTASSVLHPAAGELQRFCYLIAPNSAGGQPDLPLDSVVMGIAGSITAGDFDMLTVTVNGVNQPVSWGTNTFLVSDDASTGCTGLRLNFPLTSASDTMRVCMTMKSVYAVQSISVCFSDAGAGITPVSVLGPSALQDEGCPTTTYQEVDVCVPVTISPYATVGEATVTCCGDPTITQGTASCAGTTGGTCSFTISQRVCVAVPVAFGANAQVGNYTVNCGTAGNGNCENCAADNGTVAAAATNERTVCSNGFVPLGQTTLSDVIGVNRRYNR